MSPNRFPFHLEKDYIQTFLKAYRKFSRSIVFKNYQILSNTIEIESLREKFTKSFELMDSYSAMLEESNILSLNKTDKKKLNPWILERAVKRKYFKSGVKLDATTFRADAFEPFDTQPGVTEIFVEETIEKNLMLIKALEKETLDKLKVVIAEGIKAGSSIDDIAKNIERIAGVSEEKAKFWAQDQSNKFFGDVTRARQQAIGYEGFIWIATKDGKVRPSHLEFEGRFFDWEKGTGQSGREFPGRDYRCRCFAKPAFKDDAIDERAYKQKAETDRYRVAGEIQKAQIAFDKFYDDLTKEADEAVKAKGKELKTESGKKIHGTELQIAESKNIVDNMKRISELEKQESLMKGSQLEIGIVIDAQGNKIYLDGGVNYTNIPESINLKGSRFTHNHPNGTNISDADIKVFIESEIQELRVVTKDYTYSISNQNGKKLNYKEFKKQFDLSYEEAKGKINKDKISPSEILNIQWELTAKKFGLKYRRI
jgi:SPP1 gp7 family putative phage head morphogenesis protein